MNYLDKLAATFQNRMEELRRKKEGSGTEETEEEEKLKMPKRIDLLQAMPVRPNWPQRTVKQEE